MLWLVAGTDAFAANTVAVPQTTEVEFNDLFLQRPKGTEIDVSRYSKGNPAAPGTYRADLYVNQIWLGRREVTLKQIGPAVDNVQPCFDRELIQHIGADLSKLSEQATAKLSVAAGGGSDGGVCLSLTELIPDATALFDNGEQRLDVSVPQVAMNRQVRGYVDPRYWDDGVTAALLEYNANFYQTASTGISSNQGYVGLTAGANFGPWRFRHIGNLTVGSLSGTQYQNVQTSLERAIPALESELLIGDAFTDGTMFDSVGFRGVQLATDDRMYPESQRGYAPVVHGIANSNALVQVRQNGNILYEANVAPGPFEINDLYPTGYGGNLDVTVTEADGSTHVFEVPYAATVNAVRPGITRFSVTAGEYRNQSISSAPMLAQGIVQHGFANSITGYGGVTAANGYLAGVLGAALTTEFGAFSFDLTQADTDLPNRPGRSGQSARLAFSKRVDLTNTNVSLAAYRYSSSGYLGLADAMQLRYANGTASIGVPSGGIQSGPLPVTVNQSLLDEYAIQRSLFQLTVNQSLPSGFGSFYLSGSTENYWNRSGANTQFQAGYNNSFDGVNYGLSIARQQDLIHGKWDNRAVLTFTIPLGSGAHAPSLVTNLQRDTNGATSAQTSMAGALGEDNQVTYGTNLGYNGGSRGTPTVTTIGGNGSYVSPLATLTGSASTGGSTRQFGAGISGGLVAYGGGVAFAPSMGDTIAIIEADGASGARVTNGSGLRIDPWGHAIVSNLMPFEDNEVDIDPKGLPMNVNLQSTSQHVAPTAGAIVRLGFATEGGGRVVLMRATSPDGEALPFGAEVTDASGASVGTVAQAGRIMLRGLTADSGVLGVKWGDAADQKCSLTYSLPKKPDDETAAWTLVDARCVR